MINLKTLIGLLMLTMILLSTSCTVQIESLGTKSNEKVNTSIQGKVEFPKE